MKTYLVGGAVRDELLGLPIKDQDWVVVGSSPEELLRLGYESVGNDFPVFLHPETKEEYALARTERKSGSGYHGFVCDFGKDVTLEEDLSRRDLTINAIAKSRSGEYIDPYNGRADLEAGVLRHVSSAFAEDPLRVLRVARFAARYASLGFSVHRETYALMAEITQRGELTSLTPERVWKELSRALEEPKPSEFFHVLRRCGALAVLFPEVDCLFGVPQPPEHHPEVDTGEHVMMAVDVARERFNNPLVTWMALVHDLGKGVTPKEKWPSHICHGIKGVPLVEMLSERLRVPRDYLQMGKLVSEHHLRCHKVGEMQARSIMRLLEALDAVRRPERVTLFAQACEADACGRLGYDRRDYPQKEILIRACSAIREVSSQPFLEAGYKGLKLAEQIRRERIRRIAKKSLS
ncbi:multifunctional CCA addition/repair protein [Marinibactrum halimedae]|uniref:Multifunctional CCA protein n=1 Tax=Marinibactrum halimedae TaxID=1444977 RepID=A0AA37T8B6_9GAMM|nr:multifunctional CCA addition/repair protein [Marinibactrum halimedae]MCD9459355.1 multifunctional CCA addition/repair protein [Marinibactrum halimedae]GLS25751.1 multifunctional CCA protein [Marinibactrum halimedae]